MVDYYTPVFNRLNAVSSLAGKVFDSVRVTSAGEAVRENYVVIMNVLPVALDDERYTARQALESSGDVAVDVRVAATSAAGRRFLVDAVTTQLVGHALTVTGRTCEPIRWDLPATPGRYDPTARLHWQDLEFLFMSRRT